MRYRHGSRRVSGSVLGGIMIFNLEMLPERASKKLFFSGCYSVPRNYCAFLLLLARHAFVRRESTTLQ
jgi:hypothetical protein